jgi:fluoroacetyl-CoA thioesterase
MKPGLEIGARTSFTRVIRPEEVVPRLFPDARVMDDMPDVLASAYMIGLFEWACGEQLAPFYETGEVSLGTAFDMTHSAPTPPGLTVTIDTEVQSIDGNFIWFKVRAHDGHDLIGEGRHMRALVQKTRFDKRVAGKLAGGEAAE